MKVLLDTHAWLWWIAAPERLNQTALALITDRSTELYFSAASAWEIAIKHGLGKIGLPEAPARFLPTRLNRDGIASLPVQMVHALRVADLPAHHRDPFDRLLVAQAQIEAMPILSADRLLQAYDVEILSAGQA